MESGLNMVNRETSGNKRRHAEDTTWDGDNKKKVKGESKDHLMAESSIRNMELIKTHHEHDSFLQSQNVSQCSTEKHCAASAKYENEREEETDALSDIIEDEINNIVREPDFTSADYEGTMVPDLKFMVNKLDEVLNAQMPGLDTLQIRKQLYIAVFKLRKAFCAKRDKTLGAKQEFIVSGFVPNSVNKYLEELSEINNSTGHFLYKLHQVITEEECRVRVQLMLQELNADNEQEPSDILSLTNYLRKFLARHVWIDNQEILQRVPSESTITEVNANVPVPVKDSSTQTTNNTK